MDVHTALPIIGTAALAAGLLMPLRDGRRGRRATLGGKGPLLPRFAFEPVSVESPDDDLVTPFACTQSEVPRSPLETHEEARPLESTQRTAVPIDTRIRTTDSLAGKDSEAPTAVTVRFSPLESAASAAPRDVAESPRLAFVSSSPALDAECLDAPSVDGLATQTAGRRRERFLRVCRWLVRWSDDGGSSLQQRRATVADGADFAAAIEVATDGVGPSSSSLQHVGFTAEATADIPIADPPDPPPNVTLRVQQAKTAAIPIGSARSSEAHDDGARDAAVSQKPLGGKRVASVVPLTRLPLRRVSHEIAWYRNLAAPLEVTDDVGRLAALTAIARSATSTVPVDALIMAYAEESGEHRVMVLRALARSRSRLALESLQHALVMGTDDERILALDALATIGPSTLVRPALNDRLDTIVARASLALCPSRRRNDHAQLLDEVLEPARREGVLLLLAGILE